LFIYIQNIIKWYNFVEDIVTYNYQLIKQSYTLSKKQFGTVRRNQMFESFTVRRFDYSKWTHFRK